MNIGIVTTWFERGAAYVSMAYLEALKRYHNVYVFARGGEYYAKDDPKWDAPFVTWGKKYNRNPCQISWPQFKKWIVENSIELVIFNEQQDWEIVVDIAQLGVKSVAYIDYYTKTTIPFFDIYDAVICHTKRHYSVFKDHFQAFYIPWGTNVDLFKPKPKPNGKSLIFFHSAGMGGINNRKGTDILVKAFNKLDYEALLIIHAQVPSIKFGKEINEIINYNKKIKYIEKTVSAPGLYYLGDIYVYPSRLEGLGLTIMEALSSGLPVITTDSPPMNEFVIDGVTGKLIDVEKYLGREDGYYWAESICNEQSLIDKLLYCINQKKEIAEWKQNAREFAVKELNWKENSKKLLEVIQYIEHNPNKLDNIKKNKHKILGYTFTKRHNGNCLKNRIVRKILRKYYRLD